MNDFIPNFVGILSYVFELRHQQITQVQQLELLQCIPLIVRHASKYTYLVIDLHQHLPDIIQIVNAGELQNQIRSQQQIFLIVYEFIRSVSILKMFLPFRFHQDDNKSDY